MAQIPGISEDDISLFRSEAGRVEPVRQDKIIPEWTKPEPRPKQAIADEKRVMRELVDGPFNPQILETGDELNYRQPGIQERLLKKLKSGQFRIEAEIDLHGMTADRALEETAAFLARCRNLEKKCIKVIHGKGHGSLHGKPVLKNKLGKWLSRRSEVVAFCSARPMDGGTGALYILLRKSN